MTIPFTCLQPMNPNNTENAQNPQLPFTKFPAALDFDGAGTKVEEVGLAILDEIVPAEVVPLVVEEEEVGVAPGAIEEDLATVEVYVNGV